MQRLLVLFLLVSLLSFRPARAEWILDGTFMGGRGYNAAPAAASDGAGGAIMVWAELRGADHDIFARRIDLNGNVLWTADGVPVCTAPSDQVDVQVISDGAGGAIMAWRDNRSGDDDVYAQRINSTGGTVWPANGVPICTFAGVQAAINLVSDGASGAIIAWQDGRSGTNWDVYARRINSVGTPQWTSNGNVVVALASGQTGPEMAADGSGGVIIAWSDARNGLVDIYAQRLNASGAIQWALNGLPVCTAPTNQGLSSATSDGSGGMLLAWYDDRNGLKDIYAQRINGSGAPLWTPDGEPVCLAANDQGSPLIAGDGAGGAVIAWTDSRNGTDNNVYAQKLTAYAVPMWTLDGVALCTATGHQTLYALVPDGTGGLIAAWEDPRTGAQSDVFAAHVNAAGLSLWDYDGIAVSTAPGDQGQISATGDGLGGAIAAWSDARSGRSLIYAQRIEPRYGYWGRPEPAIKPAKDTPSDQGGHVIVRWIASQRDLSYLGGISHYSIWRSTDASAFAAATRAGGKSALTNPGSVSRDHTGPVVWKQETLAGPVYWEWIDNLPAVYQPSYSYNAPTRSDSTVVDPATHYFKVVSHETPYPQSRAWESATATARSVDNVAPAAPLLLAIRASGSNAVLTWKPVDEPDFAHYTLYRSNANGVRVVAGNFLTDEALPNYTDPGAGAGGYYYIATATDIHGNESAASNEVSLSGSTDIGDTPAITALTLRPNIPNPFSTATELTIGVAKTGDATVELFDVGGRRVLQRSLGRLERGWRKVELAARDEAGSPLASGIYLCRVSMNGQRVTGKITITR